MEEYVCTVCGYHYKPKDNNNVEFNDLPQEWVCPLCKAKKEKFEKTV